MKLMVNSLIKLGILKRISIITCQCLPNQTERRLLCNHFKLTTSLRITT